MNCQAQLNQKKGNDQYQLVDAVKVRFYRYASIGSSCEIYKEPFLIKTLSFKTFDKYSVIILRFFKILKL